MSDLFAAAAEERLRGQAPLAARLRPRTLDDLQLAHGIGPAKAEHYGRRILAAVAAATPQ